MTKQSLAPAEAREIAERMASSTVSPEVQRIQTQFRMQLAADWQIPQGARVLEIGCGQGDMTAVLAHCVGSAGHIMAVDSASPDYGAPLSLGQSAHHLKATPLGERIDFHFEYDLMNPVLSFPAEAFDCAALAHTSWYFASLEQLRGLLLLLLPWAKRLCFSEWDMEARPLEQAPHLLAVLIQGQVEAYKTESISNVRTPFSRSRFKQLLQETGWQTQFETLLDTSLLQDADWEIAHCLRHSLTEATEWNLPAKLQTLLSSQVETLRQMASNGKNHPLPAYSIVAQ